VRNATAAAAARLPTKSGTAMVRRAETAIVTTELRVTFAPGLGSWSTTTPGSAALPLVTTRATSPRRLSRPTASCCFRWRTSGTSTVDAPLLPPLSRVKNHAAARPPSTSTNRSSSQGQSSGPARRGGGGGGGGATSSSTTGHYSSTVGAPSEPRNGRSGVLTSGLVPFRGNPERGAQGILPIRVRRPNRRHVYSAPAGTPTEVPSWHAS
jgi:hypothetical protein